MSTRRVTVLGVDFASKKWTDVGTALVTFEQDARKSWTVTTKAVER
jgi:hypothetical protein